MDELDKNMEWENQPGNAMPKINKINFKKLFVILLILGFLASLGFNLQRVWQETKNKTQEEKNTAYQNGYQQGRGEAFGQIIQQVKQTGRVVMTSPEGNIILMPQPNE